MRSARRLACWVLGAGLWAGCAGDGSGGLAPRDPALGETTQRAKLAGAVVAETATITAREPLGANAWTTVASAAALAQIEWNEDDAKLLLALVLKGLCGLTGGCASWLPTALDVDAKQGVSLSAATHARLAELAGQLRRSGHEQRATAVEEWLVSAEADLDNVSSIGLSPSAVDAVIRGLSRSTATAQPNVSLANASLAKLSRASSSALPASTLSASAATAAAPSLAASSALSTPGDAYILELYAQVRGITVGEAAAACAPPDPFGFGTEALTLHKGVSAGTATCAPGTGALDSALDTSCDNFVPGEEYCLNDEPLHEWGTLDNQLPHVMNVAFAAAARRCEPCRDGDFAVGTLRTLGNWRGQKMTMCDTRAACDPALYPSAPDCPCL